MNVFYEFTDQQCTDGLQFVLVRTLFGPVVLLAESALDLPFGLVHELLLHVFVLLLFVFVRNELKRKKNTRNELKKKRILRILPWVQNNKKRLNMM